MSKIRSDFDRILKRERDQLKQLAIYAHTNQSWACRIIDKSGLEAVPEIKSLKKHMVKNLRKLAMLGAHE